MYSEICVGVLALQGAFREHVRMLGRLGLRAVEVRNPRQMDDAQGLIIPGGESTVMGKLLLEWDMLEPIRQRAQSGMPVYGSCAGLIMLCREIESYPEQPRLALLDAVVRRNAFGRQAESFESPLKVAGMEGGAFPAVFIRAPVLTYTGPQVRVLARVGQQAVAVRQGALLGTSFHPELTVDTRMHQYFAAIVRESLSCDNAI